MKVVFMGTPDFAVDTLESIVKAGHEVPLVISMPDKRKGRGKKMQATPVKESALKHDLKVHQPIKVNDEETLSLLDEIQPDVIVVVAYGQILRKHILELPKYGCVNVHASLLPKYRGAAPINWAIIKGETKTGITTMMMEKGLDTGDMLMMKEVDIDEHDHAGVLHDKLMVVGGQLLVETLSKLEKNELQPIKQNDELSTYAPMMDKTLGQIDWNKDAYEIDQLIRGTYPWPGAYTRYQDETVKILEAEKCEDCESGENGEILEVNKKYIKIKCNSGCILIKQLQFSGKKAMTVQSYLAGNDIEKGIVLK